ncbi:hypothetical protein DA075_30275 [Methylobacterium currus]|uniref:Uncharacterized protein n=2 Tax=Methylobacterium TaxID=407 RepID=A0A2R4WUP3_9HYPH|nr:hypothetical protein DA075_30275 [Methylobacterium currus]TGD95202.1 hypothetical protein EU555_29270 [Methylobacterium nonmethylotrophicum]
MPARSRHGHGPRARPTDAIHRRRRHRRLRRYYGSCGERLYNPVRRHSAMEWRTPQEFALAAAREAAE